MIDDGQVLADAELFAAGDCQVLPPIPVIRREDVPAGREDVVAVQDTVQAVLGRRARGDQSFAVSDQCPQFPHVKGRTQTAGSRLAARRRAKASVLRLSVLTKEAAINFTW